MTPPEQPDPDADRVAPPPADAPSLNPSTRVLWRGPDSIQLELGRRAVVVDGVEPDTVRQLLGSTLPSSTSLALTRAALATAGFLCTGPQRGSARPIPRLAPDLAALRVRHGREAADVLAARAAATVEIHGAGRVPAALGALLAAAGVGQIGFETSGVALLKSAQPGGLLPTDEGRPFAQAAADASVRAAPEVEILTTGLGVRPDLTVLAVDGPVEEELRDRLQRQGRAQLVVQVGGEHLVVGPLVLPGLTSCLRCADLHRIDRDPAWSALAAQLALPTKYPAAADSVLCALASAMAGLQILAYLDGDEPATLNATLELQTPGWQVRRRSWPARPDCDCIAAGEPQPTR